MKERKIDSFSKGIKICNSIMISEYSLLKTKNRQKGSIEIFLVLEDVLVKYKDFQLF